MGPTLTENQELNAVQKTYSSSHSFSLACGGRFSKRRIFLCGFKDIHILLGLIRHCGVFRQFAKLVWGAWALVLGQWSK